MAAIEEQLQPQVYENVTQNKLLEWEQAVQENIAVRQLDTKDQIEAMVRRSLVPEFMKFMMNCIKVEGAGQLGKIFKCGPVAPYEYEDPLEVKAKNWAADFARAHISGYVSLKNLLSQRSVSPRLVGGDRGPQADAQNMSDTATSAPLGGGCDKEVRQLV